MAEGPKLEDVLLPPAWIVEIRQWNLGNRRTRPDVYRRVEDLYEAYERLLGELEVSRKVLRELKAVGEDLAKAQELLSQLQQEARAFAALLGEVLP